MADGGGWVYIGKGGGGRRERGKENCLAWRRGQHGVLRSHGKVTFLQVAELALFQPNAGYFCFLPLFIYFHIHLFYYPLHHLFVKTEG